MSITEIADRLVLTSSIEGNLFPKSERETLFPLTIKAESEPIVIKGSLYARSLDVENGNIIVHGPIAARGDVTVTPGVGTFRALAGITTLSGVIIGEKTLSRRQLADGLNDCRSVVKGDIVSNQNVLLNNTIVFGSINAVNCTITNSIVLGTIHCQDQLSIEMSSLGGYLCKSVVFSGVCTLYNSLGESVETPLFLPYEDVDGTCVQCSVHLYPALRSIVGMRITREEVKDSSLSLLYPEVDWIAVTAEPDPSSSEDHPSERWVLSIGGRIADFTKVNEAAESLSEMLRVGFEFSHYNPETRNKQLEHVLKHLTSSEASILQAVCN
jgi:hypothetical protein